MPTNKKKSKRGNGGTSKRDKPPPTLSDRELEMLKMARLEQASVLKSRLTKNLGAAMGETKLIIQQLDNWVVLGEEISGSELLPSLGRNLEWKFYSRIEKYPEVWVRGCDFYGC